MKFRTLRDIQARFNFYVNARPSIYTQPLIYYSRKIYWYKIPHTFFKCTVVHSIIFDKLIPRPSQEEKRPYTGNDILSS